VSKLCSKFDDNATCKNQPWCFSFQTCYLEQLSYSLAKLVLTSVFMVPLSRIIDSTPAGYSADVGRLIPNRTVYICYKKGRDKPPITDIG